MRTDRDRLKLLKAATSNHTFTAKQAATLLKCVVFTKEQKDFLGCLAPVLSDDLEHSINTIAGTLKYEEEKKMVRDLLEKAFAARK